MAKVGRPSKYSTAEEMQKVIDKYFEECKENKRPYTITGLALALDMDRKTIIEYSHREEFSNTIKRAKLHVENFLEEHLLANGNATGTIFNLKNNFGWKDKQEVQHSGDSDAPPIWTVEIKKAKDD